MSRNCHPDLNGNTEENRSQFLTITDAYNAIKKDLKRICVLLSIDEDSSVDEVDSEYRRQLDEIEFRVKMSNKSAKESLEELKTAYFRYASEYKKDNGGW